MNLEEYQLLSSRTLKLEPPQYNSTERLLLCNALGLAGEAGEVADLIKKQVCHKHGIDRDVIAKEMGDVLWYLASLATILDLELSDIAQGNIDKLKLRYPNGFNTEDSINRDK